MLGYPKLYKREELNKLLTGVLPSSYYNNLYNPAKGNQIPFTNNGVRFTYTADGNIHAEGTTSQSYAFFWPIPSGDNTDYRLTVGHIYVIPNKYLFSGITQQSIASDVNWGRILKITGLGNGETQTTMRLYWAVGSSVSTDVNEDAEYPWLIDLTAIYGAGNEQASFNDKVKSIITYARKHKGFVQDKWYIFEKKWTWRAYITDTGLAVGGDAFARCEEHFPCTAGDVIRVKSRRLLDGYVFNIAFFASDGTYISRTTHASSTIPSSTAPENAAYYMIALKKNDATVITAYNIAAVDIMTAITPNNYNNKYNLDAGADVALPYTQYGITFSRNADGSINVEGTLDSSQQYAQWFFCGLTKNNYFFVPGHYYYQNYWYADTTKVWLSQYPISVSNKHAIAGKGRIFKINEWTGPAGRYWYDYTGISYIVNTHNAINVDVPAPVVVDLTDIFGYGQEPTSLSDSRIINLMNYIDIVGSDYEPSQWFIDGNRWSYRKHLGNSGYESNALCDCLEQEFAVNPGDTITFSNTSVCFKYILWFNGSTAMYRQAVSGNVFNVVVPDNATKAVISVNNNFAAGGNIPSNLDAIDFSVSVTN